MCEVLSKLRCDRHFKGLYDPIPTRYVFFYMTMAQVALRVISKVVPILEAEYREAHRTDGGGSHGSTMEEVEYRIRAWAIQIVPRAQSVDSSEHRRKQSVHEKAWIQG